MSIMENLLYETLCVIITGVVIAVLSIPVLMHISLLEYLFLNKTPSLNTYECF